LPLVSKNRAPGSSRCRDFRNRSTQIRNPLVGFDSPSEFARATSGRHTMETTSASSTAPPLRFGPLQRIPARGCSLRVLALPQQRRLTSSGFLNLLTLHRPAPASHVSGRIRSWGLPFRALLLSRSRTPSPAPLPSCRWINVRAATNREAASDLPTINAAARDEDPRLQGLAPRESPPP